MDNSINFSVAIDIANKKIAELNMKIIKDNSEENQHELNKWLTIREEIYNGNSKLIEKIINNEI